MHLPDLPAPHIDRSTLRYALIGGGAVAFVMAVSSLTVGLSGIGGSARVLLRATLPVAQTLFSTAMIASSTTVALMLTMLGMTSGQSVKSRFYGQIRQAATIAVGVFGVSTVMLLVLVVPFDEGDTTRTVYTVLFYGITGMSALVGGGLVAVMITLLQAIRNLIGLVSEGDDAAILAEEKSESDAESDPDASAARQAAPTA